MVLWAAGVAASPLGQLLGVPLDRAGRVHVQPDLTIPGHPEVFVLGDMAAVLQENGKPVPGVAPAAIQMGQFAAATILGDLRGEARKAFHYNDKGNLATIGRSSAVADVKGFKVSGSHRVAHLAVCPRAVSHRLPQPHPGSLGVVLGLRFLSARRAPDHRTEPLHRSSGCARRDSRQQGMSES